MVCAKPIRAGKLLKSGDWWAVWCGLIILAVAYVSAEVVVEPEKILPNRWNAESFNFDAGTYAAFAVLACVTVALAFLAIQFVLGEKLARARQSARKGWFVDVQLLVGIVSLSGISFAALLAGSNADARKFGVTEVQQCNACDILGVALRVWQ